MNQVDFVGDLPPGKPFKDIRNQRDSVAEEKAVLCKLIGERCNKAPQSVVQGYVQTVRQWQEARKKAMKVAGNKRASVSELSSTQPMTVTAHSPALKRHSECALRNGTNSAQQSTQTI